MQRLLTLSVLLLSFCGLVLSSATRAAPPPASTITQVALPVVGQSLGGGTIVQGSLLATFEATAFAGGWKISATFRADPLILSGTVNGDASGKATGSIFL